MYSSGKNIAKYTQNTLDSIFVPAPIFRVRERETRSSSAFASTCFYRPILGERASFLGVYKSK